MKVFALKQETGAISLLEATFLVGLGLVFILMIATFRMSVGQASKKDKCAIEATASAAELADPNFDPAKNCSVENATKMKNKQDGFSDLVIVALVLPLLLLLVAAAIDLSRLPVARKKLQVALLDGAFNAERLLSSQQDSPLLDSFMPPGNNLCEFGAELKNCETMLLGSNQAFLTRTIASALEEAACKVSALALEGGQVRIEFAMVRFNVNASTGELLGDPQFVGSSKQCGNLEAADNVSPEIVAKNLRRHFGELGLGAGASSLLQGYPAAQLARTVKNSKYLPSYWLVGVGQLRVKYFLGGFLGKSKEVSDYFVRPITAIAGIQREV